jgi:alkylation response protein AidB-like acyl-CoA dehydrogenase
VRLCHIGALQILRQLKQAAPTALLTQHITMHALRVAACNPRASQQCLTTILGFQRHMSFEAAGDDPLQEFRENVAEFGQSVIAPHAEEVDKGNDFPKSVNLWKEMGDFGLLGERANAHYSLMNDNS